MLNPGRIVAFASAYASNRCCHTHPSLNVPLNESGHAVLLMGMRQDTLLRQTVGLGKAAIELSSKAPDQCVVKRPIGFTRVVALTDIEADVLAIGTVQDRTHVDQPVKPRPHDGHNGRPAHIGDSSERSDCLRRAESRFSQHR